MYMYMYICIYMYMCVHIYSCQGAVYNFKSQAYIHLI